MTPASDAAVSLVGRIGPFSFSHGLMASFGKETVNRTLLLLNVEQGAPQSLNIRYNFQPTLRHGVL